MYQQVRNLSGFPAPQQFRSHRYIYPNILLYNLINMTIGCHIEISPTNTIPYAGKKLLLTPGF